MATHRLRSPENVRELLARRFANQRQSWLKGEGVWPWVVSLGAPTEKNAQQHGDVVGRWSAAWQAWHGSGTLEWHERQWRTLGTQRLPKSLSFADAAEVVNWLGEISRWQRALSRYQRLIHQWPALTLNLPRHFDTLADYAEPDFQRLEASLLWFDANPASNLYPRQLPIPGIDSKWVEGRKALLAHLAAALHGKDMDGLDFYACCGLRPLPSLTRMRLLDPKLRAYAGGLGDISAPISDLAKLTLPVQCVFIVENTQTGLAFEDLPGAIVIMGLGYGVEVLGQLPWIQGTRCLYWGDLDTHGFAILNRARTYLPDIESVLMDETTLLNNQALWCEEKRQHLDAELPRLTNEEQDVLQGLKEQRWGLSVRLEQERISWTEAWNALLSASAPRPVFLENNGT